MRIIDFKKCHVILAKLKGYDTGLFLRDNILDGVQQSMAVTLIKDDKIVCFAGIAKENDDIAHVWLIPTEYFETASLSIAKKMKWYTGEFAISLGVKKLVTMCEKDKKIKRWMEWLGFERGENMTYEKSL